MIRIALLLAVAGSGFLLAGCGDHPEGGKEASPPATAVVYTCPMHPEVTASQPGRCPKCGMDLVKR